MRTSRTSPDGSGAEGAALPGACDSLDKAMGFSPDFHGETHGVLLIFLANFMEISGREVGLTWFNPLVSTKKVLFKKQN